jgi:outer membrane biosynthesis protein TonB
METMTKSPRRLKQQVQDTVGEQVRDLPLHAVRLAMFGVGRALLLSDRLTKDYKEITEGGGVRPVIGRLRDDVQHTAEKVVVSVVERVRGGDGAEPEPEPEPARRARPAPVAEAPAKPGAGGDGEISIGKPKPAAKPAPEPEPEPSPAPKAEPAAEEKAAFEPRPESKPAAPAEAERIAADLPVPNYDEATLPQLRARLRGLSSEQVKLLREYERKHAARPDVLRMYENRIAKLNGMH